MISVKSNGRILLEDKESNFYVQEFVPKQVYSYYGNKSVWFLDNRLILLAQFMRDYFKESMTINNWHSGGSFQYRGFRPDVFYYEKQADGTYVSKRKGKYSQHRFGRGLDCNLANTTPDDMRKEILSNEELWIEAGLTTIEDGAYAPTWFHGDMRNTGMEKILIVKP
jgi:hypothetical protein